MDPISAYRSCLKPCIYVTYRTSLDRYFVSPEDMGSCEEKGGRFMFELSRFLEFEIVSIMLEDQQHLCDY